MAYLVKELSKNVFAFEKRHYICNPKREVGTVAQSVEQWTENPCVAGSIPAHTTLKTSAKVGVFCVKKLYTTSYPFKIYLLV